MGGGPGGGQDTVSSVAWTQMVRFIRVREPNQDTVY
jgi:hypothetical protein